MQRCRKHSRVQGGGQSFLEKYFRAYRKNSNSHPWGLFFDTFGCGLFEEDLDEGAYMRGGAYGIIGNMPHKSSSSFSTMSSS